MKSLVSILAASAAMAVAAPALANDPSAKSEASMEAKDNGGYDQKASAEKIDAAGTKSTSQTEVDLSVDKDGDKEKTTTTKETTDPKGLFNKETVKTKTTESLKDGKLTVEQQKSVNGDTVRDVKKSY